MTAVTFKIFTTVGISVCCPQLTPQILQHCNDELLAVRILHQQAAEQATPQDRSLCSSYLTKFLAVGHVGELSLASFDAHMKMYENSAGKERYGCSGILLGFCGNH